MNETTEAKTPSAQPPRKEGLQWLDVFGIVLLTIVATVGVGYWWLSHYIFPENFEPVTLNASEQNSLNSKLNTLGIDTQGGGSAGPLKPEPYSEEGASPRFWQSFAAGVDYIQVQDGRLLVRLKE